MAKKKKGSNLKLYIILAVVVVAIVAGGYFYNKSNEEATKVELEAVTYGTITEKVGASGKVQPINEVNLSSEVSGEIRELYVQEGDSVHEKQLLAQIRPDNFQSALDQARASLNAQKAQLARSRADAAQNEARLRQAKLTFERNKNLWEDKVISDQDYENSQADYDIAQANLTSAQENVRASQFTVKSAQAQVDDAKESLQLTKIFAPMSGVVSKLSVEKGEMIVGARQMSATEMMRIANLAEMETRVDVNENDIIRVHIGDTAVIDVDAYSYRDLKFKGIVTAIANSANETTSSDVVTEFEVKIKILASSYANMNAEQKGQESPFRPGMTASVDVITQTKKDILIVPLTAVTTRKRFELEKKGEEDNDDNENALKSKKTAKDNELVEVVFVYNDETKTVSSRKVKTGVSDFENIEILEGVEDGEVIVKGPFRVISETLSEGDLVEEMNSEEANKKPWE
ncbi:efflux RND transporter periplasmic adaptor subunit [Flammeovirga kamogawensis]|uniref:Efflux RND transporter periplasmic adaptor subunit n=1 Tax=Flammeovirga kamogawensis TaxID=373891 RepID=A0ABX8GVI6_9BACT|nr:efflux RND transporter periplasmic adaptor subunit [Flammeovirga kamogawensis]MBB6461541.1 HlyD family secretion protein [Flammeovirga kamogawensis]QWG07526.1 efflux RND transporter periplasmic adaptor subunit [Flammeovirga kamogawensis]TRX69340.1 HlyD family efflux transporter periplasmic adaptor subunit [Flammeovirga kamogawensis]